MTGSSGCEFAINIHPEGWRFPSGQSWIAGWIQPAPGQVITDVRARLDHRIILGLSWLPHPQFPKNSPGAATPPRPGFSFLLAPHAGVTCLRLEACSRLEKWTEFFRTAITPAPDAPAPVRPPSLAPSLGPLAARLLVRRKRSPRRRWADLADSLVAALMAEPLNAHPNAPFLGALEEPGEFGRLRAGRIPVTGWLAHREARITRISAVVDPLPVTILSHRLVRRDVPAAFPALGGRTDVAFVGDIAPPSDLAEPVLLKIFAELDNGETHLVFGRRFTPRFHEGATEMPPFASFPAFVRAVWELHRSATRHGLPQRSLLRTARRVWAEYAAQPIYRPGKVFRPDRRSSRHPAAANEARTGKETTAAPTGGPASGLIAAADDMSLPDASQYFRLGREALALVQQATARAGTGKIRAILDLPCGFGRVARWLQSAYPDARLIVSDIQAPAVAFCVEHMGATGVVAHVDGRHWPSLPGPFDIIWCGSLLTHLDHDQWGDHLRRFSERLAPAGVLIFTTHGLLALDWLQSGEKDYGLAPGAAIRLRHATIAKGFGFVDYPDTPGYGISVAHPGWIVEMLARDTDLQLLDLHAARWDQHQDVVVCTRRPPKKSGSPSP